MPGACHPVIPLLSKCAGCHSNHLFLCSSTPLPPSPPPHTHRHPCYLSDCGPFSICRCCTSGVLSKSQGQVKAAVLFSAFMGLLLKSQRTSKRGGGVWGGGGCSNIPPAKVSCWGSCAQRARHMMHRARLPSQPCVIHLVAGPRGERDLL